MKKIVWALFLLAAAQVAAGQQAENQQTEKTKKEKAVSKKSDTKTAANDDTKPATLDGKAFKITFIAKENANAPDEVNVEKNAQPGSVSPDKPGNKDMTLMGETKAENKMPEENTATATGAQAQTAYAALDNTKGRVSFEHGMIRIDINKDGSHLEECNYEVTTGDNDFGTFSGSCSNGYGIPADQAGTATPVEKTTVPGKTQNVKSESDISTESSTGLSDQKDQQLKGSETSDPETKTKDATAMPEKANENNTANQGKDLNVQPVTQVTTAKPVMTGEKPATAIITGFVDGKEIKGTIIIKENGNRTMYSYTGTLDNKKTKSSDELGMK